MSAVPTLRDLLVSNRDYILEEMRCRISKLPASPWVDFVLHSREGQRRLNIWLDLIIKSSEGNPQPFVQDQERVGYLRAVQGIEFRHSFDLYNSFQKVIDTILERLDANQKLSLDVLCREINGLSQVMLQAYSGSASSYLRIRQEQINEKVTNLEELYQLAHKIITITGLEELVRVVLETNARVFGAEEVCLAVCKNKQVQGLFSRSHRRVPGRIRTLIDLALKDEVNLFLDEAGEIFEDIDRSKLKRVALIPIKTNAACHGILILSNNNQGFKFTRKEQSLLNHFLYITASGLARMLMVEEIEQSREQLRLLAGKMITIQEEERRRLAGDIHDTLAQALTGICYQVQYCKELAKKNDIEVLLNRLDILVDTTYRTIDQSRQLISSLHPDLIDTVGIVPALRRFFHNFNEETGVRVFAQLPKSVRTSRDVNICLFRVVQEALTNVHKHAETKTVRVHLKAKNEGVTLIVIDKGKGFDTSPGCRWSEGQNRLGLLSMKERIEGVKGTFSINAALGKGCRIEARIPSNGEACVNDRS